MKFTHSLRAIRNSPLLSAGSSLFFVASMLASFANLLFHPIVSRDISTDDYGALGALIGLLAVFVVPASALQVAITREVSNRKRTHGEDVPIVIGPLLAQSLGAGIVIAGVLVLLSPLLQHFLHLADARTATMLAAFMVPATLGIVPRAVLLGEFRFGLLATSLLLGAVVRLALAGPLAQRHGVEGALAATVLGEVASTIMIMPFVRRFTRHVPDVEPLRVHWKDGTAAIFAFTGFWAFTSVHPFLARHYLNRQDSGLYAAAATLGQISLFIANIVATVALPRFTSSRDDGQRSRMLLVQALAFVGIVGLVASGTLWLLSSRIISAVYGSGYERSGSVLGLLALASSAWGLVYVTMHFHLARNARLPASLGWMGVIVAIVGISVQHASLHAVALTVLISAVLVLIAMVQPAFRPQASPSFDQLVSRELWDLEEPTLDITMVVPFYNPGAALKEHVERLSSELQKSNVDYEIIAVSDGSTDGSDEALARELHDPNLRYVRLEKNSGKGEALRVGLSMGRGKYLGFIDADGDIDPSLLEPYLKIVELYKPDIVLGSKRHPMSEVHYPILRVIYSWGYQQLCRVLFRLNVRDTQTGLKLIRRDAMIQILPRMLEKRFAFDLELFVVARHLGFARLFEAPIRIDHHFTSTVSWRSVRGTLVDTIAIFYRLHLVRSYDHPHRLSSIAAEERSKDGSVQNVKEVLG